MLSESCFPVRDPSLSHETYLLEQTRVLSLFQSVSYLGLLASRANADFGICVGGIDTGLKLGFQKAHPLLAGLLNPIVGLFLTTVQNGALTQLFGTSCRSLGFPLLIQCSRITSPVRVLLCRVVAASAKAMLTRKSV